MSIYDVRYTYSAPTPNSPKAIVVGCRPIAADTEQEATEILSEIHSDKPLFHVTSIRKKL